MVVEVEKAHWSKERATGKWICVSRDGEGAQRHLTEVQGHGAVVLGDHKEYRYLRAVVLVEKAHWGIEQGYCCM